MIAKPIGELAGLGILEQYRLQQPEQVQEATQKALTYQPIVWFWTITGKHINKIPQEIGQGIAAMQPTEPKDNTSISGMITNAARSDTSDSKSCCYQGFQMQ